ncbi:TPA: hypothetical protein DIV48_03410 [Candidatus Kaiserbacteria bacterium]|nr:MAG: hypothetical protein UY93_C0003G0051 [Parcubacteria group bacterium GW2011_GWA1_56_13]KKW45813.1 MAG: hypothetical protein UY97_C0014G0011 [Parcubacteria group bacterium GW2011_GWB1_57_6]HCR52660.1 hypothetical protein [Candidatus Kaiserbacteria bacterium]
MTKKTVAVVVSVAGICIGAVLLWLLFGYLGTARVDAAILEMSRACYALERGCFDREMAFAAMGFTILFYIVPGVFTAGCLLLLMEELRKKGSS